LLACVSAQAADLFLASQTAEASLGRGPVLTSVPSDVELLSQPNASFAAALVPASSNTLTDARKRPSHVIAHRKLASPLVHASASTRVYWARLEAHVRIQQNALYAFRRAQQSGTFAASDSINHRYLTYG
jgi:hypothetical protein